jgi:hypothetical protein
MAGSPSTVEPRQLRELHIRSVVPEPTSRPGPSLDDPTS